MTAPGLPGVECHVIGSDGKDAGSLNAQETSLALLADALLRSDPHWASLNSPTLTRVEANRALTIQTPGYLYLRYAVASGTPQEFWAHTAASNRVEWKEGQVAVTPHTSERQATIDRIRVKESRFNTEIERQAEARRIREAQHPHQPMGMSAAIPQRIMATVGPPQPIVIDDSTTDSDLQTIEKSIDQMLLSLGIS